MISPLLTWRTRYTDAFDCLNAWLWFDDYHRKQLRMEGGWWSVASRSRTRDRVVAKRDYLEMLLGLDTEVERPDTSHERMEREMREMFE